MTVTVDPTETNVVTALRSFLIGANGFPGALPTGTEAILGQINRVASPVSQDYAVYWPLGRKRLGTNDDEFVDAKFAGSISGASMTVTQVYSGALKIGSMIFGINVAAGTTVTGFGSGTGGIGTYVISPSQNFGPGILSAGVENLNEQVEFTVQIDVHGPNSGNNAQRISTMLRDDFGARAFAAASSTVIPLHADEPKQVPFVNDQSQYEYRWVVMAILQANVSVLDVPQEFADEAVVGLIDVDASYPG